MSQESEGALRGNESATKGLLREESLRLNYTTLSEARLEVHNDLAVSPEKLHSCQQMDINSHRMRFKALVAQVPECNIQATAPP